MAARRRAILAGVRRSGAGLLTPPVRSSRPLQSPVRPRPKWSVMRKFLLAAVALAVAVTHVPAAAGQPGRDFFDQITGPLGAFVVFPDEFGVDVRGLPVDVQALMA